MRERTDLWKQRRGDQSPSGQFLAQGVRRSVVLHIFFVFDILVVVVLVDIVVVAVVEQERQRR